MLCDRVCRSRLLPLKGGFRVRRSCHGGGDGKPEPHILRADEGSCGFRRRGPRPFRHMASGLHSAFAPLTLAYGATPHHASDWLRNAFSHREGTWMCRASHDGGRGVLSFTYGASTIKGSGGLVWLRRWLHLILDGQVMQPSRMDFERTLHRLSVRSRATAARRR